MRNYCSLADAAYLPKLLAMHESLRLHSSEPFTLYVLPMDKEAEMLLGEMVLPHLAVVLGFHETHHGMRQARANRSHKEYCWTCASNLCEWLLETGFDEITYLDADLFFFSDPEPVFAEIAERSIAITPHRLIPSKRHLEVNGLFNVGWVTFRYTFEGWTCVENWAADCRYRCSAEIGCGDQKYLDEWPAKWGSEVCQLGIGVNVAPWNLGNWTLTEGPCVDGVPIVCYHMHELEERSDGTFRLTNYDLRPEDVHLIYAPYLQAYQKAKSMIDHAFLKLESERA